MIETMDDAAGAELAAPQVHVPLRLFVFRVRPERASGDADDLPMDPTVLINPAIEPVGEDAGLGWEGCLSIPACAAACRRAAAHPLYRRRLRRQPHRTRGERVPRPCRAA